MIYWLNRAEKVKAFAFTFLLHRAFAGGLFIAIIDELTNLLIDDVHKGYNNYTLNLTSSSISGCVHLPPFGILVISWRFPSTVTVFLGSVRLMRCCGSR